MPISLNRVFTFAISFGTIPELLQAHLMHGSRKFFEGDVQLQIRVGLTKFCHYKTPTLGNQGVQISGPHSGSTRAYILSFRVIIFLFGCLKVKKLFVYS